MDLKLNVRFPVWPIHNILDATTVIDLHNKVITVETTWYNAEIPYIIAAWNKQCY